MLNVYTNALRHSAPRTKHWLNYRIPYLLIVLIAVFNVLIILCVYALFRKSLEWSLSNGGVFYKNSPFCNLSLWHIVCITLRLWEISNSKDIWKNVTKHQLMRLFAVKFILSYEQKCKVTSKFLKKENMLENNF